MPTYQYVCTECNEPLEAVQSFSDDPLTQCPACRGRLRKVFSAVGVVFKGSGFYRNDSRAGNGEKVPATSSESKESSSTSSDSSSSSKESSSKESSSKESSSKESSKDSSSSSSSTKAASSTSAA